MKIYAVLQNMAQAEWIKHVPAAIMKDIKENGDAIEVYGIAHPGESNSTVVENGQSRSVVLKWFGKILNFIKERIPRGTPAYWLHNDDNSHDNRVKLGEVISTFMDTATQKVFAIVRRFRDTIEKYTTNVASFEAPFDPISVSSRGGEVQPGDIGEITAIALANGEINQPAFEGAVKAAYLQCLKKGEEMPSNKTLSEIIGELRDHPDFKTINPLEIFEEDTLLNLEPIALKISGKEQGASNLYHQNIRLKQEKEEMKNKFDAQEQELAKAAETILGFNVRDTFSAALAKRENLTDFQKSYIEKHKEHMKIDPAVDIEKQINTSLDEMITIANELNPEQKEQTSDNSTLPPPQGQLSSDAAAYLP